MFKAVNENKSTRLYEIIVNQIRNKISSGELKPGQKLPADRELSEEFNVSRATVREAMKTLHVLGLVDIQHGQGIYISEDIEQNLIDHLTPFFFNKNDSLKNLFEIRKTLETQAAAWAAFRANPEEIVAMENEIERFEALLAEDDINREDIRRHNNKFHILIFAMAGNPVLITITNSLNELIDEIYGHTIEIPDRIEQSLKDHRKIFLAVKNRDPDKARKNMHKHLDDVEQEILEKKKSNN